MQQVRRTLRNRKGFTLVELLVVVAIIAILAAVLLPRFLGYTTKARTSRAASDIANMRSIIEAWIADEGKGSPPKADNSSTATDGIATVLQNAGVKWTGAAGGIVDPWGSSYEYGVSGQDYLLRSNGPDKTAKTADDIWCSSKTTTVQTTGGANPDVNVSNTVKSAT